MILVYENTLRKLGTEGNFGSNSKESAGNAGVPVQLLGQEDLLEKEWLTTHSSMVAWRIPWTEEPGRLLSRVSLRVRHDWVTKTHFSQPDKEHHQQ